MHWIALVFTLMFHVLSPSSHGTKLLTNSQGNSNQSPPIVTDGGSGADPWG